MRDPDCHSAKPPTVGALAVDTQRDRIGVVMGHVGARLQLRPPGGGREWDADPQHVRPAEPSNDEPRASGGAP
ncbi:hypothetical protein [Streptomyces fulvoviolaceus]|uniref:hypothetical protein n=1 Tax=Streptomyces fulvoviolaceus TaxID=285535 RepID=UPI0021C03E5F|nr:hypothetical protein [Streptomyces fulvoviolaceus]MCT9083127.1 hypothetical protein [Streptomyces fulvoviolaceus]